MADIDKDKKSNGAREAKAGDEILDTLITFSRFVQGTYRWYRENSQDPSIGFSVAAALSVVARQCQKTAQAFAEKALAHEKADGVKREIN
jgi:hypothetical protein